MEKTSELLILLGSGRTPINVVELNGSRYLTSPRGETTWSRNLRVTGEAWLKTNGREARYRAQARAIA